MPSQAYQYLHEGGMQRVREGGVQAYLIEIQVEVVQWLDVTVPTFPLASSWHFAVDWLEPCNR